MNATAALPVVGVDLAKSVFQLAITDNNWRVVEQQRLTRAQFERWFAKRAVGLVVMEACGSAHHWPRWLNAQGIEVRLLPPPYERAYVKRNKTDAADACALLGAARCADIAPVRVKSVEAQALQGLHRTRSLWMATRTSRINALRGFCREFGIVIAQGSRVDVEQIGRVLADPRSSLPALIRGTMTLLVEEVRLLELLLLAATTQNLRRMQKWLMPQASETGFNTLKAVPARRSHFLNAGGTLNKPSYLRLRASRLRSDIEFFNTIAGSGHSARRVKPRAALRRLAS
jgi:transposase